jgi:putative FmdB family regulatory protein
MPLYEYQCTKCNHAFNEILKIDDRNEPTINPCPNCKETQCIQSIMGAANLVSPNAISGLRKPKSDFKERMAQIKHQQRHVAKIKDY